MKIGALDIEKLYAGGGEALAAYLGTVQVYSQAQPTGQSSDELWYTSTNGQIVPISGVTGITVVSNTYTGGKGVIKFSGTLSTIPYNAFGDQTRLASVELSEMVTVIENEAFFGCGISSITIPGVVSIGNMAFSTSGNLSSIVLPSSLTNIGSDAFAHCTGLTSITYEGTMAQWALVTKGADWFLFVPATVVHCTDGDVNI